MNQPKLKFENKWSVDSAGDFLPIGEPMMRSYLPPGSYTANVGMTGVYLSPLNPPSDQAVHLPDCPSVKVLASIQNFLAKEERYRHFGLNYKRGIMLEGPPGSGKSFTVRRVEEAVINQGDVVLHYNGLECLVAGIETIRKIDKSRLVLVVLEDFEKFCGHARGEAAISQLLDGEHQLDRVIFLATTNYLTLIPDRIKNRPSRFDEIIHVGMPSALDREAYIRHFTQQSDIQDPAYDIGRWVAETDKLSIAHIKELCVSVMCLDNSYEDALRRIRAMAGLPAADGVKVAAAGAGAEGEAADQEEEDGNDV